MKRSKHLLAALSLCLATVVFAQDDQKKEEKPAEMKTNTRDAKALEILKKVDASIKKVHSVQYSSRTEATGAAAARSGAAEGTVIASENPPDGPRKYRIHIKTKRPGSEEVLEFTIGSDGDLFYLIDPALKVVYADIDPAVAGNRGRMARGLTMGEYLHPRPFDDELNADSVELVGTKPVGDEECYVVRVLYKGGQGESIWFFSKKDYLPRRREMLFTSRRTGEKGRTIITLSNLVVAPTFYDDPFKLEVPQGFKKTDDFAPDLP